MLWVGCILAYQARAWPKEWNIKIHVYPRETTNISSFLDWSLQNGGLLSLKIKNMLIWKQIISTQGDLPCIVFSLWQMCTLWNGHYAFVMCNCRTDFFCSKICVYKCTNSAILIVILLLYLQSSRGQLEMTAVYNRSRAPNRKAYMRGWAHKIWFWLLHENNKGTDQPAHRCRLISAFVVHSQELTQAPLVECLIA